MSSFVEFRNVGKVYHMGEVDIEALRDVNFSIEKGEFCVVVGASGAGKTTILNILGGMDSLTSGKVLLDGEEISSYNKKKLKNQSIQVILRIFLDLCSRQIEQILLLPEIKTNKQTKAVIFDQHETNHSLQLPEFIA